MNEKERHDYTEKYKDEIWRWNTLDIKDRIAYRTKEDIIKIL